ncbi:prepilin-type N-terminal cleavage/methylation domain-containing protein [Fontibacillus panacisegetis]|uniref:Prepilin-type N-terminal cleavage/methylation domain-containing protein n=1 Tax=Fontibacillus panacisegetis TaxID=670482 RepID=A0A1G7JAA2_9BACL|nr:type II secretion system protein [Fontibacillus panacisegetis]SDF21803.1 prepilin-type N-terminal cleavage/methylation domain-containing protein [Fontibacillus panacisegetis]
MYRGHKVTEESGFSLVEVVAALVIFSIVTLSLTAFFINSMDYAKGNQNKTVMVNLARNALVYLEKQPFDEIKKYFITDGKYDIKCDLTTGCPPEVSKLVSNASVFNEILNPLVNDVRFKLTIEYQRDLHNSDTMLSSVKQEERNMAQLLFPVNVVVEREDGRSGARNTTEVEGYITSERIR